MAYILSTIFTINIFWFFGGALIFKDAEKRYEYSTINRASFDLDIPAKERPLNSVEIRYDK